MLCDMVVVLQSQRIILIKIVMIVLSYVDLTELSHMSVEIAGADPGWD